MTKDTWTKIRRLLSRAVKRTRSEAAKAGLPGQAASGVCRRRAVQWHLGNLLGINLPGQPSGSGCGTIPGMSWLVPNS
jgi:hypothetical protein